MTAPNPLIIIFIICFFQEFVLSQQQPLPVTKPIISFCIGGYFGCAVFNNKQMKCWGSMSSWGTSTSSCSLLGDVSSELGDGMPYVNVSNSAGIENVSCGGSHVCVKLDTGGLVCLGENFYGQIGIGIDTDPIGEITGYVGDNLPIVNLGNGVQVLDIALGYWHTCAVVTGNKVKCYGLNAYGQLGYGDKVSRGAYSSNLGENLPFIDFGVGVEVASVYSSPASSHNCVILSAPTASAQRIKCWGLNSDFQLGYGDTNFRGDAVGEMGDNLTLVDLGTESRVKQLRVGSGHTCALLINYSLKCFGTNLSGQLASGSATKISSTGNSMPFVQIDSGKTIQLYSADFYHTCVVYDDMITMKCVGLNGYGQLGQGDTTKRGSTPTTIFTNVTEIDLGKGSIKISSIHSGSGHNCVVFEDNTVKCFGRNDYGELGIGSTDHKGDGVSEMGNNLQYVIFFAPTTAPTLNPTPNPTRSPLPPTKSPSKLPTTSPTKVCDYQSAKICKYDIKCMWKQVDGVKKCVAFDCTTLNQGKCVKQNKRCKWNKKENKCNSKIK